MSKTRAKLLSPADAWLRRMDRHLANAAKRWRSPTMGRYEVARALERNGAWRSERELTREAVLALTLDVQAWLAKAPDLARTSNVVRALVSVRRYLRAHAEPAYEVLDVLRHAAYEDENKRVGVVRAQLRGMFGKHTERVSDDAISRALVMDTNGHVITTW